MTLWIGVGVAVWVGVVVALWALEHRKSVKTPTPYRGRPQGWDV